MSMESGLFDIIHSARAMRRLKPDPVPDDLIAAKGFTRSRRYVSVDPEQTSPIYLVLYEFESDDITASIQDLLRIAMSEFAAGRHIDCVGSVTELPSQIWQEIDPASLKPLERLEYPTQVPETIRRRVEGILQRQ